MKTLTKIIVLALVAVSLVSMAIPASAAIEMRVSASGGLNLRKEANATSDVVKLIPNGGTVFVHQDVGYQNGYWWNWVNYKPSPSDPGYWGYVVEDYLVPVFANSHPQTWQEAFSTATLSTSNPHRFGTKNVQLCLIEAKKLTAGNADGIFGQKTADAVKAFQSSTGLVADGVVGENTKLKLWQLHGAYLKSHGEVN